MKNLKNIIGLSVLVTTLFIQFLNAGSAYKKVGAYNLTEKMSVLDSILYYVEIIRDESNNQLAQGKSRAAIYHLMEDKGLDMDIKSAIKDDIDIILKSKKKSNLDAAYQRLVGTYNKINAKANIVDATIEATEMVQNASPEKLEETIAQANQKIKDAEQAEQSFMGWMYSKAKRFVTGPVDYVFGKEASYAKTAFYAAVGVAVLAAGGYGAYKYFNIADTDFIVNLTGQDMWARQMMQKIDEEYPNVPKNLKRQYIQKSKESKELWNSMEERGYEATLAKHNELDKQVEEVEKQLEAASPKNKPLDLKHKLSKLAQKELFTEKYGNLSNDEVLGNLKQLVQKDQENPSNKQIQNQMYAFKDELFHRGVFTENSDFWNLKSQVRSEMKKDTTVKKIDSK